MQRQLTGQPRVYEANPEEITKPDIIAPALRFTFDSEPSGFELRRPRPELPKYSDWYQTRDTLNEATVVDGPLLRSPRAPSEPQVSEPLPLPRSGTRHRKPSGEHPTSAAPHANELASDAALRPTSRPGRRAQAGVPNDDRRARTVAPDAPPPVVRRSRTRELLLALGVALISAVLSTSLANGGLTRIVGAVSAPEATPRLIDGSLKRTADHIVRAVSVPVKTPAPTSSQEAAPSSETSDVPVVRFDDLPLAKQDARAKRAQRLAQRRSGAKRR